MSESKPVLTADAIERLADALHEARCGGAQWPGSGDGPPVPWPVTHREWDVATAKALDLLGVGFRAVSHPPVQPDELREAVEKRAAVMEGWAAPPDVQPAGRWLSLPVALAILRGTHPALSQLRGKP